MNLQIDFLPITTVLGICKLLYAFMKNNFVSKRLLSVPIFLISQACLFSMEVIPKSNPTFIEGTKL